jgi:hypothetical protein
MRIHYYSNEAALALNYCTEMHSMACLSTRCCHTLTLQLQVRQYCTSTV